MTKKDIKDEEKRLHDDAVKFLNAATTVTYTITEVTKPEYIDWVGKNITQQQ